MDPKQPLWMPRGSVRAIIALAFTGATIAGVMLTLQAGTDIPASLAALLALTGTIVNAYFEKRQSAP